MGPNNENSVPFQNPAVRRELVLGIAATLLFFLAALLVPVMGFLAGVFTPLPTLIFFYRWGRPLGYAIPGGAALAGSVILLYLNMAMSIPYFLELIYLGLFLGMGMRRQWPVEMTIGSSSLFVFLMAAVTFVLIQGGMNGEILRHIEESFRSAIEITLQQYGVPSADRQLLEEALQQSVPTIVRLLPGAALSSAIVVSWLNVLVTKRYCRIHGFPLPPWKEWSQWKTPEFLVWPVIASGFVLLLPSGFLRIVASNALIVLGTVYFFQGLAIIAFYFEKWSLPRFLRGIFYGFILLQQFATLGAIIIGLFDVWFDFRRLSRKPG